jgi:hypothetical protein
MAPQALTIPAFAVPGRDGREALELRIALEKSDAETTAVKGFGFADGVESDVADSADRLLAPAPPSESPVRSCSSPLATARHPR